jgi:hypothetical protein
MQADDVAQCPKQRHVGIRINPVHGTVHLKFDHSASLLGDFTSK